jgi:chemotaxis protein MotB
MNSAKARYEKEAKNLKAVVKAAGLKDDVQVEPTERGIVIRLAGDALFDSGQSTLKPGVKDKLARIERQLLQFNRELEIVGHTDGAPYRYPGGNWYLGMDRALAVTMFFIQHDYPGAKLNPRTRANFDPIKPWPDGHPEASMPENRRIEILVLAPAANVPGTPTEKIIRAAETVESPAISNPADLDLIGDLAATAKGVN